MEKKTFEEEIRGLLDVWNRSLLDKDVEAAAALREDGYTATLPDGVVLSKDEELAMVSSPGHSVESIDVRRVEVRGGADEATLLFDNLIKGEFVGERIDGLYKYTLSLRKTGGVWRARGARLTIEAAPGTRPADGAPAQTPPPGATFALTKLIPRSIKSWVKARVKRLSSEAAPTFPELAYFPYKPGQDFALPPGRPEASGSADELPVPPEELWLGYNYPVHGKAHVGKMLEVVYASGFSFKRGDRILDLGCGAGRMIRHLRDLAETCEVWGTDISAEHIYWCKKNLSPPFNFATTTKTPHLPFEDRSFQLIYCGSVFTHIDDLADAWLLELRRILAPEGRLYVTIHDNHTIELLESGRHDSAGVVKSIRAAETYREAKGSFGMFTVGRDADSQVFYDVEYFSKMVRPMFDILSVTPEAYFYQTAFLLKRK
ncbi:MAG: methyltransferase domain-containing protein [Acidobacteria bacterium]|nr:methyltransferase domain-containing protein [Acidobacteriota bacterium]